MQWYESKKPGLGLIFLNYLDGYFQTLKTGKVIFPIKVKPVYRELALKKFPFVIVYEVVKINIIVYSVFNTYQNPEKKI